MTPEELLQGLMFEAENNSTFHGFSKESLEFFDSFPEDRSLSNEWWRVQKEVNENYLKPEFEALIQSIIDIVSKFDNGIEKKPKTCIGRPTNQNKGEALAYRWAAIHSEGTDKRIDVQFFINLTSVGLRLGIYSGLHMREPDAWRARSKRIINNKESVFEQVQILQGIGYRMGKTTSQDHANKSGGIEYLPSTSEEMIKIITTDKQFDIIKTVDVRGFSAREIIGTVLTAFAETRMLYQLLQPSSYSNYARDLV